MALTTEVPGPSSSWRPGASRISHLQLSSEQPGGSHYGLQAMSGPAMFSQQRARPSTPEVIAESYGRRLHGLDLISTRKLAALSASVARLDAHAASRAAAITRTLDGGGAAAGFSGSGADLATPAAEVRTSAARDATVPPLSLTASEAAPCQGSSGHRLGPGAEADGGLGPGGQAAGGHSENSLKDVAERGASVVRLLALQDRILHGALQAQQQALSAASSPSGSSPGATRLQGPRYSSGPGPTAPWAEGRGTGTLTPEEQRRLDQLGIRHDSKVAAATVKLFRLTPRGGSDGSAPSTPVTPPNTHRGANPSIGGRSLWGSADDADILLDGLQPPQSRRQLAKSREFQTMTKFLQSLKLEDEQSLITQARSFARYGAGSKHDDNQQPVPPGQFSRSITSPSQRPLVSSTAGVPPHGATYSGAGTAQMGIGPGTPLASGPGRGDAVGGGNTPSAARGLTAGLGLAGAAEGVAGPAPGPPRTPGSGMAGTGPGPLGGASRVRLMTPQTPTGQGQAGSQPQTPGGTANRGLASPSKRALARSLRLDLSAISTGQPHHRDLLDGLLRAVELFVGEGGGPGGGTGGGATGGDGLAGSPHRASDGKEGGEEEGEEELAVTLTDLLAAIAAAAAKAQQDPVTPFGGVYGSPEHMVDRVRKKGALAVLSNPAGYREEVAAGEVAMYREVAERCRAALAQATKYPRDKALTADLYKRLFTLHHCRPYFVAPRETLPEMVLPLRSVSPRGLTRQSSDPFFLTSPELVVDSVFLSRVETSEAEDMVDSTTVRERQVRKDWNRVVRKDAFRTLVGGTDPGVTSGSTGLGHALDACLAVLLQHKDSLKAAFNYYASMGPSTSDTCFTLAPVGWRSFISDCSLTANLPPATASGARSRQPSAVLAKHLDPSLVGAAGLTGALPLAPSLPAAGGGGLGGSGPRTRTSAGPRDMAATGGLGTAGGPWSGAGDIGSSASAPPKTAEGSGHGLHARQPPNSLADGIFMAVHSEAEKRLLDGQLNTERTLLRFEWYEALIRLATIRHVQAAPADKKCASIAAALDHMWVTEVLPSLPPAALHEPNQWRIARLYGDPDVNRLLLEHLDLLMALYDQATCHRPDQLLHLADWVGLLQSCDLIGDATGVTLHAAKLCFLRSLLVVVDELGGWRRAVCGDRADFLEGLARLAEEMAPPPIEEVADALREVGLYGRELKAAMVHPWLQYYTAVPPENLVARREAAAAAARNTITGEEPILPPPPPTASRPGTRARRVTLTSSTPQTAAGPSGRVSLLPRVDNHTAASSLAAGITGSKPSNTTSSSSTAAPAAGPPAPSPPPPAPDPSATSVVSSSTASSAPPPPRLSFCLAALLDLLLGRLRSHWECGEDNSKLLERLRGVAVAGRGKAALAATGVGPALGPSPSVVASGLVGPPEHHVLSIHPQLHTFKYG